MSSNPARTRTNSLNSLHHNEFKQQSNIGGAEMGVVLKFPADLQKIIDLWDTLPSEIKQTILTLIKHTQLTHERNP